MCRVSAPPACRKECDQDRHESRHHRQLKTQFQPTLISSVIGRPVHMDSPKSKRAAPAIQGTN